MMFLADAARNTITEAKKNQKWKKKTTSLDAEHSQNGDNIQTVIVPWVKVPNHLLHLSNGLLSDQAHECLHSELNDVPVATV